MERSAPSLKRGEAKSHVMVPDGPDRIPPFSVVDLFSGAGGMSYGFHKHPDFRLMAAADAEIGKPSMGRGSLQCNSTYEKNIGIKPKSLDLSRVAPEELRAELGVGDQKINLLCVCPPCTGFSRTNPLNHMRDDSRNSLVQKAALFASALDADIVVMENARELLQGNFKDHYNTFREHLELAGYNVAGRTYMLSRFGLPQIRERAIVIASKSRLPIYTLDALWAGHSVADEALTVKTAFDAIPPDATGINSYPEFKDIRVSERLAAIPHDGGSWVDLLKNPRADKLLTNAMKRIVQLKKIGSYPDVYGRMAWNRPAPTIKRECAHIGNGRYAHPTEDRLCSIRELAILQGFPNDFVFNGNSLSNNYRHIGDAVPPLVSYQLAHLCAWMLLDKKPALSDVLLPDTHLNASHIRQNMERSLFNEENIIEPITRGRTKGHGIACRAADGNRSAG